ncbi:hypothetical protein [Micromonospora sp. C95]|uniref:DUF7919 family protein n=1 Tax=Micromonospora sp. C95 TaxID=2824882 RepID=UPI001B362043|nr:hypothetical protein [Micromonospora sp. C95]MBQ1024002.1 hypothetical protein [Micromonospora sp. C95]
MAFFADLTPYTYWEPYDTSGRWRPDEPWPSLPLLNVGWLDCSHPFQTGAPPDELIPALTKLAKVRVRQTRGHHHCELCLRDMGDAAREAIQQGLIPRGSAEFQVRGHGVVYAAPQLLTHYVAAHAYLPPLVFCEAAIRVAELSR